MLVSTEQADGRSLWPCSRVCTDARVCVRVCMCETNVGEGLPEASHLMTRSSTLKTVTDSGCVVMAGGILTARKHKNKAVKKQKKTCDSEN